MDSPASALNNPYGFPNHVWEAHCKNSESRSCGLVEGKHISGGLVFRNGQFQFVADDCDAVKILSGETLEVRIP